MLRPRSWVVCALLLGAASAFGAPVKEDGVLRYKFKEGEKLRYSLLEAGVMEIEVAGNSVKIESNMSFDLSWHVTKVSKDGKVTVTQKVERVRLDGNGPTGKMSYDSKGDKEPDGAGKEIAKVLKPFAGAEMTLILDRRGQIESLKFSEKLTQALAALPPQSTSAVAEGSIRRMIGQCLPVMSEKEPSRGDIWDSRLEAKFAGVINFTSDSKHTYEGAVKRAGRTVEKFVNKPVLTLSADPAAGTIKLVDQEVGCVSYFDKATGRVLESVYTQKIELHVSDKNQTVKMKGDVKTTLKLIEKD